MDIPEYFIIHDIRTKKDFKGITISGYKRQDVMNTFQNCMINNKLEDAIRWCVELHSTGMNNNIWESLKNIYFKYIHINNPKYFFYLFKREKEYIDIISKYPPKHEIFSRNNQEIRNLFAELTAISTLTKKNNLFLQKSLPTINNKSFEKNDIKNRMISKNLDKVNNYIDNLTTNEFKLVINEISNNITLKDGTFENCIYWYLWYEKIDNIKKNEKKMSKIDFSNLNDTKNHWIFLLWKLLIDIGEKYLNKNNLVFLKKIYNEYCKNFKLNTMSKKKYYIFIAFYILKDNKNNIKWNIPIFQQEYLMIQTNANINRVYENIIRNNESELSSEAKEHLYKRYNQLYINKICNNNYQLEKVSNTKLNEDIHKDINVVLFTNYPDFKHNEDEDEDENQKDLLVSKNKSLKDIEDVKIDIKNKKIDALNHFITYKKAKIKEPQEESSSEKEEPIIKNIFLVKK